MSEHNRYAYGVIEDEDLSFTLDTEGVNGATELTTVSYRSLSAVVTDIDEMEPERTDENTRAHDDVLQEVMLHGDGRTVVPMQYGMVFKTDRALKGVLRGARPAFRRSLRDVEGMAELGVKLVAESDADLDRDGVRADVSERLRAVSDGESKSERFSDRLVFNRSYLVERGARDDFDDAIDDIEADYEDEAMIRYTGPWAPYSFVNVEIGAQR